MAKKDYVDGRGRPVEVHIDESSEHVRKRIVCEAVPFRQQNSKIRRPKSRHPDVEEDLSVTEKTKMLEFLSSVHCLQRSEIARALEKSKVADDVRLKDGEEDEVVTKMFHRKQKVHAVQPVVNNLNSKFHAASTTEKVQRLRRSENSSFNLIITSPTKRQSMKVLSPTTESDDTYEVHAPSTAVGVQSNTYSRTVLLLEESQCPKTPRALQMAVVHAFAAGEISHRCLRTDLVREEQCTKSAGGEQLCGEDCGYAGDESATAHETMEDCGDEADLVDTASDTEVGVTAAKRSFWSIFVAPTGASLLAKRITLLPSEKLVDADLAGGSRPLPSEKSLGRDLVVAEGTRGAGARGSEALNASVREVKRQISTLLRKLPPGARAVVLKVNSQQTRAQLEKHIGRWGLSYEEMEALLRKQRFSDEKREWSSKPRKQQKKEAKSLAWEAAAKEAELADIEKKMLEFHKKQIKLKGITLLPSPHESSKGKKSMAIIEGEVRVKLAYREPIGKVKCGSQLSIDSCNPIGVGSQSANIVCSDPLSLGTWDVVREVPLCVTNARAAPIGDFWEHMKKFAFERAAHLFPWHLEWPSQDNLMKIRFKLRLKNLYPGDWDDSYVMQMVGNNIRERRARVRSKENVPIANGLTLESWNAIYHCLADPKYQNKSTKCRVAADQRTKTKGFTHKLGPQGLEGLLKNLMMSSAEILVRQKLTLRREMGFPSYFKRLLVLSLTVTQ